MESILVQVLSELRGLKEQLQLSERNRGDSVALKGIRMSLSRAFKDDPIFRKKLRAWLTATAGYVSVFWEEVISVIVEDTEGTKQLATIAGVSHEEITDALKNDACAMSIVKEFLKARRTAIGGFAVDIFDTLEIMAEASPSSDDWVTTEQYTTFSDKLLKSLGLAGEDVTEVKCTLCWGVAHIDYQIYKKLLENGRCLVKSLVAEDLLRQTEEYPEQPNDSGDKSAKSPAKRQRINTGELLRAFYDARKVDVV